MSILETIIWIVTTIIVGGFRILGLIFIWFLLIGFTVHYSWKSKILQKIFDGLFWIGDD